MTYESAIDAWVRQLLPGRPTFAALARGLPGVYPAEIAAGLRRLGVSVPMGRSDLLQPALGPTPHPADADWRFDAETCEAIRHEIDRVGGSAARVALLGCPSVFLRLSEDSRPILIEPNTAWLEWLHGEGLHAVHGSADLLPVADRDVVVADPPWYPAEYPYFLSVASRIARPGAHLLWAWPAEGTRPGLDLEWRDLLATASKMGWRSSHIHRRALGYATPWFEAQALRAAGLPVVAGWRRGDLAIFVRGDSELPEVASRPEYPWKAARFGFLDLRVRWQDRADLPADPRMVSIVEGDVLASVSRRHPARERALACTGGNRVFWCARPDLLLQLARTLADDLEHALAEVERTLDRSLTSEEDSWCEETREQLLVLEAIERHDYHAAHAVPAAHPLRSPSRTSPLHSR
jgi:hypothetical protein